MANPQHKITRGTLANPVLPPVTSTAIMMRIMAEAGVIGEIGQEATTRARKVNVTSSRSKEQLPWVLRKFSST